MTEDSLRIAFAGTPEFAAEHLRALLKAGHRVVAVTCQPDRPRGRGKTLQPGPVKALALEHGLPVYQPADLRDPEALETLRSLQLDLLVVVAYGLLLPAELLELPRFGCINVHASLLPRWRGAAPIERAILAGDEISGVTIMQMEAGLDTGPILLQSSTHIDPDDTSASLGQRLSELGQQALLEALERIAAGKLDARAQNDGLATYAHKLGKEEALIRWERPATAIQRQINAFYPRSPAWCFLHGQRIRILRAQAQAALDASAAPGTITRADKNGLLVACGEDALRIDELQLPGKKAAPVAALLNGQPELFQPGTPLTSSVESKDE